MSEYDEEIARLRGEIAELQTRLHKRDEDAESLAQRIAALETEIIRLIEQRDFFKHQSNLNLAENYRLRERLYRNPYDHNFYNEQ